MEAEALSHRWFMAALVYFMLGTALGVYMGASGDHALVSVHSHAALLGWMSMGLTGALYRSFPFAAKSKLAAWHFYVYQITVPVLLAAVAMLAVGDRRAEPLAAIASTGLLASVATFFGIVWLGRHRAERPAGVASRTSAPF